MCSTNWKVKLTRQAEKDLKYWKLQGLNLIRINIKASEFITNPGSHVAVVISFLITLLQ